MDVNPAMLIVDQPLSVESTDFDFAAHYPRELALPEVARLHDHYRGVDTHALHRGSRDPRRHAGGDFIYGDTPVPLVHRLLTMVGAGGDDLFVDLGCGCGKAVLTAALLTGRAVGVDVVEGAVAFCRASARSLGLDNAAFFHRNLFDHDLSEATLIFVAATTFTAWTRERLKRHLATSPRGARVISATHALASSHLRLLETVPALFSWSGKGDGHTFSFHLHERV